MPKNEIDYSNTIIYKITCKDTNINDVYVGHTTNFVQRKHAHKQSCINIKSPNYKCKIYEVIRNNGGWDNWCMQIINFFNCRDHYEARQKEQEYFVLLNATLNSIEPMPKPKFKSIKICEKNDYKCSKQNNIKMETLGDNLVAKSGESGNSKYYCESCNYKCFKKYNWEKHITTSKHLKAIEKWQKVANNQFCCENCGKEYNDRTGLWRHKQKCNSHPTNTIITKQDEPSDKELMCMLIKQNSELIKEHSDIKEMILEIVKNGISL